MEIEFSHHSMDRKTQRDDYILPSNIYFKNKKKIPDLRNILIRKGTWYKKEDLYGLTRYYCIVNNLEVYCGILIDSHEPYILITTYYPYSGKLKRRLFPRGKENYERFDIGVKA
tara:strand:- start:309 stop:650 length:342 start_codon:yes stop_codon:yes gene_type:complete